MCQNCVKEQYPDRNNICCDSGVYLVNFKGCAECQQKDSIEQINRTQTDVDQEEVVGYQHVCKNCDHVVACHEHKFRVEDDFQLYEMDCMLCGTADDQRSILPADPRQQPMFF